MRVLQADERRPLSKKPIPKLKVEVSAENLYIALVANRQSRL